MIKAIIYFLLVASCYGQTLDFKSCMLYRNQARAPRDSIVYWNFNSDSGKDMTPSNNVAIFDRNLSTTTTPTMTNGPAGGARIDTRCYKTFLASKEMAYTTYHTSVGSTNSGPYANTGSVCTLSFWANAINNSSTYQTLFNFTVDLNTGSPYFDWNAIWLTYNFIYTQNANIGGSAGMSFPSTATNQWIYFTFVKSNHYVGLWTNAVYSKSFTNDLFDSGLPTENGQRLFIGGAALIGGSRCSNPGSYYYDEVSLLYRALTGPEITNQYLRAQRR